MLAAVGIFISGFSSIATGLNFIVTIHRLRAPGLTWYRMPVFLWSLYSLSVLLVLATPVLAMTLLLVVLERLFHIGVFDPAIGGDPLLFQHLFWFYSHPAVYMMILPGFGVVSEIIPAFSRKRIFGYKFIVWASVSIAVISFFVWGHHMFVAGTSLYSAVVFSILSYLVAVPSAIKVFNWLGTMHKGYISFDAPMLYALGFIGLFTIGGLTGLWVAALAADVHLTQTYFVVAHFHYIMVGGMVSAFFGGLHYWWPKITGRMYPEMWARVAALIMFIGFNLTFFPQFILGYLGMPRRYYSYAPEFQVLNVLSSAGATILAGGLSSAAGLSRLVAVLWRARARESLARHGARMADAIAAADGEFHRDARRHGGSIRLSAARRPCSSMSSAALRAGFPVCERPHQSQTAVAGMWLFLATEVLFFGGLILCWIYSRHWNQPGFDAGARETELWIGTLNTAILVTSSFVYATGLAFIRAGNTRRLIQCLRGARLVLGVAFLALKFGLEWREDFRQASVSRRHPTFKITGPSEGGARLFFVFYFISTALHGLHMM